MACLGLACCASWLPQELEGSEAEHRVDPVCACVPPATSCLFSTVQPWSQTSFQSTLSGTGGHPVQLTRLIAQPPSAQGAAQARKQALGSFLQGDKST